MADSTKGCCEEQGRGESRCYGTVLLSCFSILLVYRGNNEGVYAIRVFVQTVLTLAAQPKTASEGHFLGFLSMGIRDEKRRFLCI